jgi:hypothetical protein
VFPVPLPLPVVELDRAIARVEIHAAPQAVRARLGPPTRVKRGPWRIGFIARTWTYADRGITVEFLLGGDRLYVYGVSTRTGLDRTRRGIGVGSREADVRRKVPDVHCYVDPYIGRHCRRPNEGGVGGTLFLIRRGRVRVVKIFGPVF